MDQIIWLYVAIGNLLYYILKVFVFKSYTVRFGRYSRSRFDFEEFFGHKAGFYMIAWGLLGSTFFTVVYFIFNT